MPVTIPDPVNQNKKKLIKIPKFVKVLLGELTRGGSEHTTLRIMHNLITPICLGYCIGGIDFDKDPSAVIAGAIGFICTVIYGNYYCRRFWKQTNIIAKIGEEVGIIRGWVDSTIDRVNRCDFCSGRREREILPIPRSTEFTD